MKKRLSLISIVAATLLGGCAYTQITIKAPKSEPAPTVGHIDIDTNFDYKGNAGSNGSTTEGSRAALDVSRGEAPSNLR